MLLLLLQVPSARAGEEDDRFQQHYDRAVSLFNDKEYDGAAQEFLAAYQIRQLPRLLLNIGQAYRKAGRARQALAFYEHFLRVEPHLDPRLKDDVDRFINTTHAMLELPTAAPVPAPPVKKPAPPPHPPAQVAVAAPKVPPPKAAVVQVKPSPAPPPPLPKAVVVQVKLSPVSLRVPTRQEPRPGASLPVVRALPIPYRPLRPAKWTLFGLGGATLIAGISLWALDGHQTCNHPPEQTQCPLLLNNAPHGIVLFTIGVAMMGSSAVLFGLEYRRKATGMAWAKADRGG